jgi:hypothetical protein
MEKFEPIVDNTVVTQDPIEVVIIRYLKRLQLQNYRMQAQIEKTQVYLHLKDIDKWTSFDFYNYFCKKFFEKYNREYRINGSLVKSYSKIELFISQLGISNNEYKSFIDATFSRHFNAVIIPILGNICSKSLYNKMFGNLPKKMNDAYLLDKAIEKESEKFENAIIDDKRFWYGTTKSIFEKKTD